MRAILFDLDDTLFPERDYVLSGFRAVAAWAAQRCALDPAAAFGELRALYAAGVRGDTFNRWLDARGLAGALPIAELVGVYRDHEPDLAPFPEVPALLAELGGRHRLGLVSDGYLGVQQRKLAALGLRPHFQAVVFSDQLGRAHWKPSRLPFETALAQLGVAPADSVYVGDNPLKDFLGARELGAGTIWVRRPDGEYADRQPPTPRHEPDITVGALAELQGALARHFGGRG